MTAASVFFGVIAIQRAIDGHPIEAAWWGLLVTLTDKLDGFLASLLKGGSEFGVQFDSLADLIGFGVVPATIFYSYYASHPSVSLPVPLLRVICAVYVMAAALRLARFNVLAQAGPQQHYLGTPSTGTAGMMLSVFLIIVKYAGPEYAAPEVSDSWRLGLPSTAALVPYIPLVLLIGGFGMLSPLRVPKIGKTTNAKVNSFTVLAVVVGYGFVVVRRLPEYMFIAGVYYLTICVLYHLRTRPTHPAAEQHLASQA